MTSLEGKTIFVCVDSDEDTTLYIADEDDVEAYYDDNPDADVWAVAREVGRPMTEAEQALLPNIQGGLVY